MALLGVVVLSPIVQSRDWDSFPVSSFPMFSRGDRGHVRGLAHAVLVHRDGSKSAAPPSLVGTPEPMVATSIIASHIAKGTASDLCTFIADRAARGSTAALAGEIASIEIVVSVYDTHRYFASPPSREPIARDVHATCNITGSVALQRNDRR
jgi:hypothetical protein